MADFTAGASRLHGVPNPHDEPDSPRGNAAWDTIELIGKTPEDFYAPMGFEFWAGLDKTPEADAIMFLARQYFGDGNICFLTAPIRTSGCIDGKLAWARQHYPDIPVLFSSRAASGGEPPKHFCASKNSVLLDDRQKNVFDFRDAGGVGWVVPRPWNDHWGYEPHLIRELKLFLFSLVD